MIKLTRLGQKSIYNFHWKDSFFSENTNVTNNTETPEHEQEPQEPQEPHQEWQDPLKQNLKVLFLVISF